MNQRLCVICGERLNVGDAEYHIDCLLDSELTLDFLSMSKLQTDYREEKHSQKNRHKKREEN